MIKFDDWKAYLKSRLGDIYLWGGQGESTTVNDYGVLTDAYIKRRETSTTNANRVIKLRNERFKKRKPLRAYDCSGLGVAYLLEQNEIKNDMTAQGIFNKCTEIKLKDIKAGDFVFRYSTASKIYHIGYVLDGLQVVESKGRDVGVVISQLDKKYWNKYGRSKFVEIKEYEFSRNLKKGSIGDDVKSLQALLILNGYDSIGAIDGDFGNKTLEALKSYQQKQKLTVDGVAGVKTLTKLGGVYLK